MKAEIGQNRISTERARAKGGGGTRTTDDRGPMKGTTPGIGRLSSETKKTPALGRGFEARQCKEALAE